LSDDDNNENESHNSHDNDLHDNNENEGDKDSNNNDSQDFDSDDDNHEYKNDHDSQSNVENNNNNNNSDFQTFTTTATIMTTTTTTMTTKRTTTTTLTATTTTKKATTTAITGLARMAAPPATHSQKCFFQQRHFVQGRVHQHTYLSSVRTAASSAVQSNPPHVCLHESAAPSFYNSMAAARSAWCIMDKECQKRSAGARRNIRRHDRGRRASAAIVPRYSRLPGIHTAPCRFPGKKRSHHVARTMTAGDDDDKVNCLRNNGSRSAHL
jgi:hypothetical protein